MPSITPVEAVAAALQSATTYLMPQDYTFQFYKAANDANTVLPPIWGHGYYTQRAINLRTRKEVELVSVLHGQHAWPGSKDHAGDLPLIGEPNHNFSATDMIYDFLSRQSNEPVKPPPKVVTIRLDAPPINSGIWPAPVD
jgi:hypothetical protein